MTNVIVNELEDWLSERPLWLQDASVRIASDSIIDEECIKELVALCKQEAGINNKSISLIPRKVTRGIFKGTENSCDLVLDSISDLCGINALAPKKPLELGSAAMAIIFGRNGSGKSGYVRVLKHACGARMQGKLLGNVFNQKSVQQSCKFTVKKGTEKKQIAWTSADGMNEELSAIEIYDTDCGFIYTNNENEVTYEPWLLSRLSMLTDICVKVSVEIQSEISQQVIKKPTLPQDYSATQIGLWYNKLTYKTAQKDIDTKCIWNSDLEKELDSLKLRLVEANPAERAKSIRQRKNSINNILKTVDSLNKGLGNDICQEFFSHKADAALKRIVSSEDAQKFFNSMPLDGVGTESWKLLWEQARAYSQQSAYPEDGYPNTGYNARCVLCQQPLNEEAKQRMCSFEEFIKGNLEKQALDAELTFKKLCDNIIQLPSDEVIDLLFSSAGITDENDIVQLKGIFSGFGNRRNSLFSADSLDEVKSCPNIDSLKSLSEISKTLEVQACAYEEDAANENRDAIQLKTKELESQKWVSQQKKLIEDEVLHLQILYKLEQADKLTSTTVLSKKKSELSDVLVTNEYIARFQSELRTLGAPHIKVELIKTKAQKGHIYHQIKLTGCTVNAKTSEILSEGELRIVSLAAFLADVEGKKGKAPFVFDDPISSLDQDYEEATVHRLVQLCLRRQVIVFTHRLSLMALLEEDAKKEGVETTVICLRNEQWGAGEPGETPIFVKSPEKAINALINERLPRANKILSELGQSEYESIAKGICSDFRILLERFIENKLLCDVVQRFRRAVNTMGKLNKLALITSEDCKIFDDMMTKYSKFEHSQSDELPVFLPSPDELKLDMEKIRNWYIEFSRRVG